MHRRLRLRAGRAPFRGVRLAANRRAGESRIGGGTTGRTRSLRPAAHPHIDQIRGHGRKPGTVACRTAGGRPIATARSRVRTRRGLPSRRRGPNAHGRIERRTADRHRAPTDLRAPDRRPDRTARPSPARLRHLLREPIVPHVRPHRETRVARALAVTSHLGARPARAGAAHGKTSAPNSCGKLAARASPSPGGRTAWRRLRSKLTCLKYSPSSAAPGSSRSS
jgi:hypothetical protein